MAKTNKNEEIEKAIERNLKDIAKLKRDFPVYYGVTSEIICALQMDLIDLKKELKRYTDKYGILEE